MRLKPANFNRHIANIGQEVLWRRSWACACVSQDTGAPDPKHAACKGKGRLWDAPVKTVCGVPSQSTYAKLIAAGLWDSGDMALTIPRNSPMWESAGRFDRVTMLNATDVFSQPLKRGSPSERLLFKPATITRVFWLHPATREPVEGSIPTVDDDGIITWGDGAPAAGVSYSITGTRYAEYFIFDNYPSSRNEHSGMQLPKKVQLRRFDLFGRK